jgi:ABC-type uncharacterized transport system permease subunit
MPVLASGLIGAKPWPRRRSSSRPRPNPCTVAQAVTIAFVGAVVSYSVATILLFVELVRKAPIAGLRPWSTRTLAVGAALHLGYIIVASLASHTCPVLSSLPLGVSLMAWFAVALCLWLGRSRLFILGVFMAPLALTLLIGAQFVHSDNRDATLPRSLLATHVTANLLGLALFLMAAAVATFYLVQSSRLKRKDARHAAGRLPPLDVLENVEQRLLLAGFPLLTFGIISGAAFSRSLIGGSELALLRAGLAAAGWLMLAAVLLLRRLAGWSGRRAAWGTITSAACVLLVVVVYALRPLFGGGP